MAEKGQKLLVSLPVLVILPPQDRLVIPAPISAEREGCPKTCSGPCMTLQRGGHEDVGLQACCAGRGPFLLLVCPKLLHIRNQRIPLPFPDLSDKKMSYFQVQESAVSVPGRFFVSKSTLAGRRQHTIDSSHIVSELMPSYSV